MTENTKKLFGEFPPTSKQEWNDNIKKELKGSDPEKLIWKTKGGITVNPFYTREDTEEFAYQNIPPGEFPFLRGNNSDNNYWFIRQDLLIGEISATNKIAVDSISKGANSLCFVFDNARGLNIADFEKLLNNIPLSEVEINFDAKKGSTNLLNLLIEYCFKQKIHPKLIKGSLNFDPIKKLNLKGKFCKSKEYSFDKSADLIKEGNELGNFRIISINARDFHNSGSTITQVLGFSLAQANEYLAELTNRGLEIDEIAKRIKFNFAVGSNYFTEIAKFRAARLLWANIIDAYKPDSRDSAKMFIHAETSSWNKTIFDPNVNMLRSTTESMSSILGGVDSLTVIPYDASFRKESEFSRRIARNTQIILKEESFFDKVADPSAGSYYIENMTDKIAEDAWKIFLATEKKGGYINCFLKNHIQDSIANIAQQRDMNIAQSKEILLGTNQFPNISEKFSEQANTFTNTSNEFDLTDTVAQPLCLYRGAEPFEELRLRTENGKQPKVFLLTYGNLSMRKARATFSTNFFACAGFDIIDNSGFKSIEDGIKESRDANAEIVVICSSDEEYKDIVPPIYDKLKDRAIVVVAGYPKDIIEELKEKGITNFIHVRSNVLEVLNNLQEQLGIE